MRNFTKYGSYVRSKYWFFLAVLMITRLPAQVVLEGIVKDSRSGDPIQYASVAVLDADADTISTGGITNQNGDFRIPDVAPGKYVLEIEFIGFQQIQSEIFTVYEGEQPEKGMGEFLLEPEILELDAVDVSVAAPAIMTAVAKTVYDADQLYSASGGTCCDVMKSIPSVDVAADGEVSLRGSPEVTILLNGRRAGILGGDRRTNIMDVPVPADMVDKIEVITNPSAKQDPDGMVGVINIVLKDNQDSGFNGHVNANVGNTDKYNGGAYFNFRKDRINHFWNISTEDISQSGTGYRRSELVLLPSGEITGQNLRKVNTATRNQTSYFSGGSRYNYSDNTFVKGELRLVPFKRTQDETIELENQYLDLHKQEDGLLQLLDLDFLSAVERRYRLSGDLALELQNRDVNQSGRENGSAMAVSLQGSTELERRILNLDYERYITPSFKFEAGVKDRYLTQKRPRSVLIGDTEYATDFTYRERIRAAYLNLEYTTFMEDMVFSGGIRLEDAETEGNSDMDSLLFNLDGFSSDHISNRTDYLTPYTKWYPSFLVRYKPNLFTTVQTGYSARVNRPTADFADPFPRNLFEPSVIRTGNPKLEPEFIHAFELKLSQIKPTWNWEAALFGQQIENVVREDEDMLPDTTSIITWKNVGIGTNVGMEGRVKFNPFSFWDITLTGLYFRTKTDHTEEDDLAGTLSGFQGRLSQVFTFSGGGKLELDSRFYSPEQIPTGTVYPNGLANLNVSYRRSLWDDRLELSLKLLDAFDNEERQSETSEMELNGGLWNLVDYTKPSRRTFFLNIKYKFGTAGKKSKSEKTQESERYRY